MALARPQTDAGLEEARRALEAVAAEPAEQLLRAVADEQRADDAPDGELAKFHVSSRLLLLAGTTIVVLARRGP